MTKTVFHFFISLKSATLTFLPGQYASVIIDKTIRRQYTFCSDPNKTDRFEFVVDVSPMGPGSKYFLEKQVGDTIEFLAPLGNFSLSENSLKKIFVATGTGIAPFRSMILNGKKMSNWSLYWGLRYEDDIYWDQEFRAFVDQYRGFQYFLCLSKPSENWEHSIPSSSEFGRMAGHVTEHVFRQEKNLQKSEIYLCGNSAMIREMESRLFALKIPKEQIKKDLFY